MKITKSILILYHKNIISNIKRKTQSFHKKKRKTRKKKDICYQAITFGDRRK